MELVRPPAPPWYEDRRRLVSLAEWLREQGHEPAGTAEWLRFLDEPWHWEHFYDAMVTEEREAELERLADEEHAFRREGRYWPGPGDAA